MQLSIEDKLELYQTMLLLRRFEERVGIAYRQGQIPGFIHLYIGEEAVATAVCAHLTERDWVTSTHRGHGHALAKGVPPREVMAELFGRETGVSGGRGGSMHLYSTRYGLLGTNGIVGPSIINGAGAGFTARYKGTDQVAVAFFGDGAVNTGSFHEGLNLAAIWNLPVVFVCENNLYATEMSFLNATAGQSVAKRAASYDMPGFELDGQDVLQIYEVAGQAIQRARSGEGPTLIECRTYRYVGHHEGDPGTGYRTQEEVEQWKQHDPLQKLQASLKGEGVRQETFDALEDEIGEVVEDAVTYSDQSPWPQPDDAFTRIFASPI